MAVTSGTIVGVDTKLPNNLQTPLQAALVLFTISGTYAQSDNSIVSAVATAIQDSRRNGKTVTLVDAMLYQAAFDASSSTAGLLLCAKTIAISGADITFELTESATANTIDVSTELSNGTIPTLGSPLGFLVTFTEA
jgi:hypothetical protein